MNTCDSFTENVYVRAIAILLSCTVFRALLVSVSGYPLSFTGVWTMGPFLIALIVLKRRAEMLGMANSASAARTCACFILLAIYLPESNEAIMHLARSRPYVDDALGCADVFLHFDWIAYAKWLRSETLLWNLCSIAYLSIWLQVIIVGAILGMQKKGDRACEFFVAQTLTLSATCLCSAFFPALGAFVHWNGSYEIGPWANELAVGDHMTETLNWIRAPLWVTPKFQIFHAVVSFPSYHAACCVILIWASWSKRMIALPLIALNFAMLAATPIQGSHYLVDVLAGGLVALLCIISAKSIIHYKMDFSGARVSTIIKPFVLSS